MNATKFGGLMPRANESVNYQYDALGRRVVRQDKKTGRTEFTHDGMDVIQDRFEKNDGTLSTTNYINGLGIDDKLKITTGTTSKYFLTDHLGSTVGMADTNGNVTESATYDSFGRTISSNLTTRYGFTGRETDEATGLMYYRARFYDPQIGRFTSEDPIGFAGGINSYSYVGNSPNNLVDPLGLQASSPFNDHILVELERLHKNFNRPLPNGNIEFLQAGGSYGKKSEGRVFRTIWSIALSKRCQDAFKKAGLQDPLTSIQKGIVVGPASRLYDTPAQTLGITDDRIVKAYQDDFKYSPFGGVGNAGTVRDIPGQLPRTTDGRPRIFLSGRAFGDDEVWLERYMFSHDLLRTAITHEFIHVGGQGRTPSNSWFGPTHDLGGYEYYNYIMEQCGCEEY